MNKNQIKASESVHIQADDFTLIHGIGPGIEKRLHQANIHTFAQLSALTPEQVADLLSDMIGMTLKRVVDQDWIGQARQLAAQSSQQADMEIDEMPANGHMHYAVFTTEFLLDEANHVRRTRVMHVQSQSETSWAGWDGTRLVSFFTNSADLKIPQPAVAQPEGVLVGAGKLAVAPGEAGQEEISGRLQLHELAMISTHSEGPQKLLFNDEPFDINLTLDILDLKAPRDVPLSYSAMVYAKKIGQGSRVMVGKEEGSSLPQDQLELEVKGIKLSRGIYRIETFVELKTDLPEADQPLTGLMAMTEGSLVQVI
jgi:hypothetical protein